MYKNHILLAIIACICIANATFAHPRLTVVVIVDGMTQENLNTMRPYWSAGGLRFLDEEAFHTSVTFPHQVYGGQETLATIMTGTTPSHHGIMADMYFDRKDRTAKHILVDPNTYGIGTQKTLSPRSLVSTTITDEWRMQQGPEAKIYAIGLQPEATILMAGHAANACCWLDNQTKKWVTTSFYSEGLPSVADNMNMSGKINMMLQEKWTPIMNIVMYNYPTEQERKRSFSYHNKQYLLQSPAANKLVLKLAIEQLKDQQMGKDHIPDLLLLQLNTISPKAQSDAIESAEQEDMYMRINDQMGNFIEQLNRYIGKNHYQIIVVGRPIKGYSTETYAKANMPVQRFNTDRAAALTSSYLMAIHGYERWVDGGFGPFIYLNRMLIEEKNMSLENMQRQVANFLMEFEGVQLAYPFHEAITVDDRHSIYSKHAGDVYFQLQDNWLLDSSDNTPYDFVIQTQPNAPILYWAENMTAFPNNLLQATDIKTLIINGNINQ